VAVPWSRTQPEQNCLPTRRREDGSYVICSDEPPTRGCEQHAPLFAERAYSVERAGDAWRSITIGDSSGDSEPVSVGAVAEPVTDPFGFGGASEIVEQECLEIQDIPQFAER
jgi:hypothetical protein